MNAFEVEEVAFETLDNAQGMTCFHNFKEYKLQHKHYLEELVFHHVEPMSWFELGFVQTLDFWLEITLDVYSNNLYCLSWFYNGAFPYDTWEEKYDNSLCEQVFSVMYVGHTKEGPEYSFASIASVSINNCI